jgi:hypothetical protein
MAQANRLWFRAIDTDYLVYVLAPPPPIMTRQTAAQTIAYLHPPPALSVTHNTRKYMDHDK